MIAGVDCLKDLTHEQALVLGVVAAIVVSKVHCFRYFRSFVFPVVIAFLVLRAQNPARPSITELLFNIIRWLNNKYVEHFLMDVVGIVFLAAIINIVGTLLFSNWHKLQKDVIDWGFKQVRNLSFVRATLEQEQVKVEKEFDKDLKEKSRAFGEANLKLPKKGLKPEAILKFMETATHTEDVKWESGHVSGAVYNGQRKHIALLNEAFSKYSIANPLHPDIWPSVMKFDSEVIAMTADLVNGGHESVCGSSTSGGTESIILAIKAHRDYFREYHGINEPELVCAVTAHAAVDKACDLMNIKLIKVPIDPISCKIDMDALKAAIGPNTIMMYASAPNYPQGVIDPVREMGKLAVKYTIGLHVDCCLGGYVLPFAKRMGYPLPDFDFSVPV